MYTSQSFATEPVRSICPQSTGHIGTCRPKSPKRPEHCHCSLAGSTRADRALGGRGSSYPGDRRVDADDAVSPSNCIVFAHKADRVGSLVSPVLVEAFYGRWWLPRGGRSQGHRRRLSESARPEERSANGQMTVRGVQASHDRVAHSADEWQRGLTFCYGNK